MAGLRDTISAVLKMNNVTRRDLEEQKAAPVPNSNRSPWSQGVLLSEIDPARLGEILLSVRRGEIPVEYLELAQEIERRDLHYGSVLSTRKQAVEGLNIIVEAAGEDAKSQEIAEAVTRDIVKSPAILDLIKNSLDALGKGFAVNEIIWNTSGQTWKPEGYVWKDQRWFQYDQNDGKTLLLRDPYGIEGSRLQHFKFVIHEPLLRSGPQILGGLAYSALYMWLIKAYDVSSWAAFVDRFGYPVRLGKYGKKATKQDITTLKRAVAAIGSDIGAVIPDSMMIDIIESKGPAQNAEVYEKLANWANKELSKLVLGQTSSTEGTPGALGNESSREEVRQDIIEADAVQLARTLNRDLVTPYVNFNFGPQGSYPLIVLKQIESQDVKLIVESVKELGPMGLRVKADEVRSMLGLSRPQDDDEVIGGKVNDQEPDKQKTAANNALALNAQGVAEAEEEILSEAGNDFIEISDEIEIVLTKALDETSSYDDFLQLLEVLSAQWPAEKTAELMAVATFKAHILGMEEFNKE